MGTRRIRSDDPVSQGPALITFAYIMIVKMMIILVMVLMMMMILVMVLMMMMLPVACWLAKAGVD